MKQESREEFSDWPHGLLAIGTFGNKELGESNEIQDAEEDHLVGEDPSSSHDLQDFTPEEIGKLQKELTKLLTRKPTSQDKEKETANLPLDRFLNCPSSLEVDRRVSNTAIGDVDDKEDDIERTISVILGRCKDICENNKKKAIGKKSISFLLKKIFVCRSGFAPQPSLRDTLQESRMEKVCLTLCSFACMSNKHFAFCHDHKHFSMPKLSISPYVVFRLRNSYSRVPRFATLRMQS